MDEYHFARNAQSISKIYHEVLLLMKFSQTKPEVKKMNINYNDLFYTNIKKNVEKGFVNDKYENIETEYFNYNDFILPNHHVGVEPREKILR